MAVKSIKLGAELHPNSKNITYGAPDTNQLQSSRFKQLLEHLYRNGDYAYYWCPTGDEQHNKVSYWYKTNDIKDAPRAWIQYQDTYFSVHPSNVRHGQFQRCRINDIAAINCLFAEFDTDDISEKSAVLQSIHSLAVAPSVIIDSGGGYHCYWLLENSFIVSTAEQRDRVRSLQYAWVDYVGGDDGSKDIARVLRVPGSKNHKPGRDKATVSIIEWNPEKLYQIDDMESIVQHIIDERIANESRHVHTNGSQPHNGVVSTASGIVGLMLNGSNGGLAGQLWQGDISHYRNDHSKADQALCNYLAFYTGRDPQRMDELFRQSGLYRDKWDRDDYREQTIQRAIAGCQDVYTPSNGVAAQAVKQAETLLNSNKLKPVQQSVSTHHSDTSIFDEHSYDDEGNAQCVFQLHGDSFINCAAYGWMYYNGTHWDSSCAESTLIRCVVDTLQQRRKHGVMTNNETMIKCSKPSNANVKNCIALFKSLTERNVDIFDKSPDLLNCANGVVDLRNGAIHNHSPTHYFTYCIDIDYNPSADYVDWLEFLHNVTGSHEITEYLQKACGYSATGYTNEECLFYVYGPTRSGKGTFTETILNILGKPLGVESDFATFTAKREGDTQNFDLAPLKPARLIIASESSKYDSLNEAKVKLATGGNWIRCAFKHRDHFEYKPQFKIWLVSNHKVTGDVDDDAFWGRIRVVVFPHSHLGKEDKTLKAKLSTPEMLEGILAWIVEGSVAWFNSPNGLEAPQAVKDATKDTRNEQDNVQQWLSEDCKTDDPNAFAKNIDIYPRYENWCQMNGVTPKKQKGLSQSLAKKGFLQDRRKINSVLSRGFLGISL